MSVGVDVAKYWRVEANSHNANIVPLLFLQKGDPTVHAVLQLGCFFYQWLHPFHIWANSMATLSLMAASTGSWMR